MTRQRLFWPGVLLIVMALLLLLPAVALAEGPSASDLAPLDGRPTPVTFTGPIVSKADTVPGEWIIGDQTVLVTRHTRFHPASRLMQVGDEVGVAAFERDGQLIAYYIRKLNNEPEHRHFRGPIREITDTYWVVAGRRVLITDDTVIDGDTPDVGDMAEVWATATAEGLVADKITVTDMPAHGQRVVFRGEVQAIDNNTWTIADKTVLVDENTRIVGDPQVGDMAGVVGLAQADGSVLADLIVRLENDQDRVGFMGFITDITVPVTDNVIAIWTVERPAFRDHEAKTWQVVITPDTRVDTRQGEAEVGAWVKGGGALNDDGSIQAVAAKVTRPPRVPFGGEVTEKPPEGVIGDWVIGGTVVHVSDQTRILGDPPEVGDQAGGFGVLQMDNSVNALLLGPARPPLPDQP